MEKPPWPRPLRRRFFSSKKGGFFVLALGIFLVHLAYLPGLTSSLFSIDDNGLVEAPQVISKWDLTTFKTLFTVGNHVDFYPVRDFSYLLDYQLFGKDWAKWKLHNLLIFDQIIFSVFILFCLLKIPPLAAAMLSLLWALHPMHTEMICWLSARKDLLALVYTGYGSIIYLLARRKDSHLLFFLSFCLLFLSLFSKATFSTLPLIALFFAVHPTFQTSRKSRLWTLLLFALGLFSSVFQAWFYSQVNSVTFSIPYQQRLLSSMAAQGKLWLGILVPSLNIVDTFNLGNWLQINQRFVIPGGIFFVGMVIASMLSMFNPRRFTTACAAFLVLYLPVSGVVFPHRNFYSVRYFEGPFLFFYCFLCYFAFQYFSKLKVSKNFSSETIRHVSYSIGIGWFFLLMLVLAKTQDEAFLWSTPSGVFEKAIYESPNNLNLKASLYIGLIQQYNTFADSREFLAPTLNQLQDTLVPLCEKTSQNLENCTAYLAYRFHSVKSSEEKGQLLNQYKKALIQNWGNSDSSLYYELAYQLTAGTFPEKKKLEEWQHKNKYLQTSLPRAMKWVSVCLLEGPEKASELLKTFEHQHLMNPGDIDTFLQTVVHPQIQPKLLPCKTVS